MDVDLGLQGIGLLVLMAAVFAAAAQLLFRHTSRWMWLVGGGAYFVGGLLTSEGLFGWATVEDLQPNIDGLSFDEAMLGGLVVGLVVVLGAWYAVRQGRRAPSAHV